MFIGHEVLIHHLVATLVDTLVAPMVGGDVHVRAVRLGHHLQFQFATILKVARHFVIHVSFLGQVAVDSLRFVVELGGVVGGTRHDATVLALAGLGLPDEHGLGSLSTLLLHDFILVDKVLLSHLASILVLERVVLRDKRNVAHWLPDWLLL